MSGISMRLMTAVPSESAKSPAGVLQAFASSCQCRPMAFPTTSAYCRPTIRLCSEALLPQGKKSQQSLTCAEALLECLHLLVEHKQVSHAFIIPCTPKAVHT